MNLEHTPAYFDTYSQVCHHMAKARIILRIISEEEDRAHIADRAAVKKTEFLSGMNSIIDQQLPVGGKFTYAYIQTIIDFASTLDWTNADDLQKLLAMQEIDET